MDRWCEMKISRFLFSRNFVPFEGDESLVLSEAMTGDWDGKYIQVKLKLSKPRGGIGDDIRQAFSERGGEVLSVEVENAGGNTGSCNFC